VNALHIATAAVGSSEIADGSVTSADLASFLSVDSLIAGGLLAVPFGTVFPATNPAGQLFFQMGANRLWVSNGISWFALN
jgi:hypothetical protein